MCRFFFECLSFLLCIFLWGCQLEPPLEPIAIDTPIKWKYEQDCNDTESYSQWWEIFHHPILNELEEMALMNNPGLQAAMERVSEARNFAKIVRSQLFPEVNLNPFFYNRGVLFEQFSVTGNHFLRAHQRHFALPIVLKYEVDLWGKYRDEYKSAFLQAEAEAWDYQASLLILTTDLANAYFQLRIQDSLIDLFKATILTRKKALSITQNRFKTKVNDFTPVALSELDLHIVEAQYENALRLRGLFENQIAILIGKPPSEFCMEHNAITELPPKIPSGLPVDIMRRRPDVIAQERIMASIHAQIGVAYASYFPSVDLVGSAGFLSPNFKDFLTNWSRLWMYGANISQFVFDAGARYYNVEMTWAEYGEAVSLYKENILIAFKEVEDALLNLQQILKESAAVEKSVKAAEKAYALAFNRYLTGVDDYLAVADNERQVLDNQRIYTELLGLSYANTVQLIKALGGAWQ